MRVPFLDLRAAHEELRPEIEDAVAKVIASGRFILGPQVEAFEAEFAAYCSAKHAIGVGNGFDALVLALRALDVQEGDDVLVPSNTFVATWLAVSSVGANPVPVEPDQETYNLAAANLEAAITGRTKAIIPVHLYGQPADLDAVHRVAAKHGLPVIEDAAQAHGALYKGRRIGSHSHLVCWSFYPGKNLGAMGDGGAITTEDEKLAARLRDLRNYGSNRKYYVNSLGINSRLDSLQAAILAVKLRRLDEWNARRSEVAGAYLRRIEHDEIRLPKTPEWASPVWHLFVIATQRRDAFQAHLANRGVETLIHYPVPPHAQVAYEGLEIPADRVPLATQLSQEIVSLPIGPHVTRDQVDAVIDAVNAFN